MVDEVRFLNLWTRCGGQDGHNVWLNLDRHYAEDHRAYHGWIHISAMLKEFDAVRAAPEFTSVDFDDVELAIFFHDVIYDPKRTDNEERSAQLFKEVAAGLEQDRISHVADIILATARHEASQDPSTRLLIDLDLAILGAPSNEYRRYAGSIRAEYHHVPSREWRIGRSKVIEKFQARPAIFQTSLFRDRLEASARERIAEELDSLQR